MEFEEDYFDGDAGEPRPRRKRRRKPKPVKAFEPAEDTVAMPEQVIAPVLPSLTDWPLPPVKDLYLLRADHGRRPVDWLWKLSTYFLQQKRKPWKKLGCVPLGPLVAFRERMAKCVTDRDQETLLTKYSSLYEALEIAKQPLDHPTRQALELLILGGLTVNEIASKLGIEPSIVTVYEEVFFDVRSRLTTPSFIVCEAIRYHDDDPLTRQARELRHMAYAGGRHVAVTLINTFCLPSRAQPGQNVMEMLREEFVAQLCCKGNIAIRMLPLGDPKVRKRLIQRFIGVSKRKVRQREKQEEENQAHLREGARVGMARIKADLGLRCPSSPSNSESDKSPTKSS